MKWICSSILLLLGSLGLLADDASKAPISNKNRQLVIVTTPDWNAIPGRLFLFELKEDKWKQVESWSVVVGRNGLAWGNGLHPETGAAPQKREGDGKSPAGVFTLPHAFGSEPPSKLKQVKIAYLPLNSMIECVDDTNSFHYGSIVFRNKIRKPDWNSSEKMLAVGEQYRLGVVVDHNAKPRVRGKGSCIFLHIWKDKDTGTAGCTAMEAANMQKLLHWLDPLKAPLLVQLPQPEYQRLQANWELPPLK